MKMKMENKIKNLIELRFFIIYQLNKITKIKKGYCGQYFLFLTTLWPFFIYLMPHLFRSIVATFDGRRQIKRELIVMYLKQRNKFLIPQYLVFSPCVSCARRRTRESM